MLHSCKQCFGTFGRSEWVKAATANLILIFQNVTLCPITSHGALVPGFLFGSAIQKGYKGIHVSWQDTVQEEGFPKRDIHIFRRWDSILCVVLVLLRGCFVAKPPRNDVVCLCCVSVLSLLFCLPKKVTKKGSRPAITACCLRGALMGLGCCCGTGLCSCYSEVASSQSLLARTLWVYVMCSCCPYFFACPKK